MTASILPIIGQGSQPGEEDGVQLDYLPMPEEMVTYRMPSLNGSLSAGELASAKVVVEQLLQHLAGYPASAPAIDLLGLNAASRAFIDELLGEGEVAMIAGGPQPMKIQESVLAGVWRLQQRAGETLLSDRLEVGEVPDNLQQLAFAQAAAQIEVGDLSALPEGIMNAPPLLAELNAKLQSYRPGVEAHVINLSLLPQTEQDLALLDAKLGRGSLSILSRGYGNCRISATATRHVWWVQYFNSQDTLILNTLEVGDVPSVARAAKEDIADSSERLQEIVKVYW